MEIQQFLNEFLGEAVEPQEEEVVSYEFQESFLVKEAIEQRKDLKVYLESLEKDLFKVEEDLVQDYISKVPNLKQLESKIKECDSFLESMGSMFLGFEQSLQKVTDEIQKLNQRNLFLSRHLLDLSQAERELSHTLDGMVLSPQMIKLLVEGDVNEEYMKQVCFLDQKMKYVKSNKNAQIKAFKDIGPELEKLRNKCSEKIRDFFIDKIKHLILKQNSVNLHMIQSMFLKYKSLYSFLMQWNSEVGAETRQHYVNAVSKYYHHVFQGYLTKISKLVHPMEKIQDWFKSKSDLKLNSRLLDVMDINAPVVLMHSRNGKENSEQIFRSIFRMILDTSSSEFLFCSDFFLNQSKNLGPASVISSAVVQQVLEPCFLMALDYMDDLEFDYFGLQMSWMVHKQHVQVLKFRKIELMFLNNYLDQLQSKIHLRIKQTINELKKQKITHSWLQRYVELVHFLYSFEFEPSHNDLRNYVEEQERKNLNSIFFLQQQIKCDENIFWGNKLQHRIMDYVEELMVDFDFLINFVQNAEISNSKTDYEQIQMKLSNKEELLKNIKSKIQAKYSDKLAKLIFLKSEDYLKMFQMRFEALIN